MNVIPGAPERRHLDRVPVRHARGQVARRRGGRLRRRGDARVRPRHVAVVARPTGRGGCGPRPVDRGVSAVPRRDGSARPVRRQPASRRAEVRPAGRARRPRPGVLLVENREGTRRRRSHCGAAAQPGGPRRAARTPARVRSRAVGTHSYARGCLAHRPSASTTPRWGCVSTASMCCRSDNDPSVIAQVAVDKVFHVQLADAPRLNMDVREWSLHYRMFPGQGSLDVAGFLSRILAMGYTGPIALEVFNDVYQQEDPRHAATDAMRSHACARRGSGHARPRETLPSSSSTATCRRLRGSAVSRSPSSLWTRCRLRSSHVPSPPSGSPTSGSIAPSRCSCGSRAALGSCSISPRERSIDPATASICALAVESTDPAASMRRAERLLAPKLARRRGPDETDLSSVATPDGTALFFCDSDRERDWLDDFGPTGTSAGASPAARRDRSCVDHRVDRRLRPVRVVLPLRPRPRAGGVHGDHRSLRSHPQLVGKRSRADSVRITLSTTPLRRGDWAPGVSSPQLVAFATDDAIACAKIMRERGAPILEMPGNYYDDLDARLSLPAGFVDESSRELDPVRPRRAWRVPALLHRDAGLARVLRGGPAHRRL